MKRFSGEPDDRHHEPDRAAEEDLWFLPGPIEDEPELLAPPPRRFGAGAGAGAREAPILAEWRAAEAGLAARLARVAGRLGALDERLRHGPEGWGHRLALIEASDLSWLIGDRIAPDRLALWMALRLTGTQDDTAALARVGWAARRLTGGPGPEPDLAAFLDRRDTTESADGAGEARSTLLGPRFRDDFHGAVRDALGLGAEPLGERADGWLEMMAQAADLHPISRACAGFHLWGLVGLGQPGDALEAAVVAARVAASEMGWGASRIAPTGTRAAIFTPLAMGGAMHHAGGLRAGGPPAARLARWLEGMEAASRAAMRQLDDLEAWSARAEAAMAVLSGRTPPALRRVLAEWPLVSAPMAEALTGASRDAVQRNLAWMEARGLVSEVTGQGRFRMWRATI